MSSKIRRNITFVLSSLIILSICAGCDVFALPGSETNDTGAGGTPGASSEQTQNTDITLTVGTLPLSVITSLGVGYMADIVFAKAGLDSDQISAGRFRFLVAEDPEVICELQIVKNSGDLVIQTAIQSDTSGHKLLFSPNADLKPIDDFMMIAGDLHLDIGEYAQQSVLEIALGEPLRVDSSTDQNNLTTKRRMRTLYYRGLTIDLWQETEPAYADNWLISQINCTSTEFVSPRGLTVGLTYQAVLAMLGTGDFNIAPDTLPIPGRLTISKEDPANDGTNKQIEIIMKDGKVFMITIKTLE